MKQLTVTSQIHSRLISARNLALSKIPSCSCTGIVSETKQDIEGKYYKEYKFVLTLENATEFDLEEYTSYRNMITKAFIGVYQKEELKWITKLE